MDLSKVLIMFLIVIAMSISGCSDVNYFLNSKRDIETEIIMNNKKINLSNKNKVNKVLKNIRGSDYYKGNTNFEEYGEKVLYIRYGINNKFGENDYINFWSDSHKKEIIISNAVHMFMIIHDMDKIKIKLDEPINEEFTINRNDVEEVYGMALENYKINKENLNDILTLDAIEELWCLVND